MILEGGIVFSINCGGAVTERISLRPFGRVGVVTASNTSSRSLKAAVLEVIFSRTISSFSSSVLSSLLFPRTIPVGSSDTM